MALDGMLPRRWWEFLVARLTPTTIGVIKLCRNGDDMGAEALHVMAMNARLSNFSNIIIADVVARLCEKSLLDAKSPLV